MRHAVVLLLGHRNVIHNQELEPTLLASLSGHKNGVEQSSSAAAKDPEKATDLISVLQAVIKEDQEEIRIRMAFLAKKYAEAISESKAPE